MTTIHTTPVIWIAMRTASASLALSERIQSFAEAHSLTDVKTESGRVRHAIGQHASAWLVVDSNSDLAADLKDFANSCSGLNDCFRCLVIGDSADAGWPDETIHLPAHALTTTILDRLRLETHALRIQSRRNRTLNQLRQRP